MSQLLAKFEDVTEWPYSQLASQGLLKKSFVDKENIQLKQKFSKPKRGCLVTGIPKIIPSSSNDRGSTTPGERLKRGELF